MRIRDFQNLQKDRLNAVEALVNGHCTAIAEDSLDVASAVTAQLSSAGGVALVVTTPRMRRNGCAAGGIPVEGRLAVKCIELPALNRVAGHLTALDAAEIVSHALEAPGIEFDEIDQTADERSGTVTATASFTCCILLTNEN